MTSAPPDRTVVSADGTRIVMSVVGSGPPLVLVPGAFQHRRFGGLAEIATALADSFTVGYFDRRGRGESGDTPPYAPESELDDLRAVITELGGSAVAVGLCAGGALVLTALAAGLPITRSVIWEPPYRVAGEPEATEPYEERLRALLDRGRRATATRYYLTRVLGMTWRRALSLRSRAPVWRGLLDSATALDREAATLNDLRLPAATLAQIRTPTLVIVGSDSPDWMKHAVQAVVEHVPGAAHTVLQNQTHDVEPDVIAPVAAAFLSE
ncbi:alpha/beta fold hydrolase [Curtobacterium ammoniigenes]|uniref:alpha/beta fold hydrolase n=1 Tax=Curtobacterium ammoniigenes TaxID=395387 RepID=UPI00082A6F63|nr:alpha/beta hydrolase [Curtobacterium ammoniigenes]